jgi:hypothetical protein
VSDVISKLLELSDGDYVRYDDVVKALQAMQGDAVNGGCQQTRDHVNAQYTKIQDFVIGHGLYKGQSADKSHADIVIALAVKALQAMQGEAEPVAWKHSCAALLTDGVELWIDKCPHCGKPRTRPQPVVDVNQQLVEALKHIMKMQTFGYIVLGEEATTKARKALLSAAKGETE